MLQIALLIGAYLLGSIPTALILSRRLKGVDIREAGNGNMGAQNTYHVLGQKPAIFVFIIDLIKGALPVLIAQFWGFDLYIQYLAGICAILGHDFPVFAGFKGGQGTATTAGTMMALFPWQTVSGLALYGILYLFTRKSSLSAGFAGGLIALLLVISAEWTMLLYAVPVFLFIPVKMWIDKPRRNAIAARQLRK